MTKLKHRLATLATLGILVLILSATGFGQAKRTLIDETTGESAKTGTADTANKKESNTTSASTTETPSATSAQKPQPIAGSGLTQTFTAVFHDPIDGNNITHAQILINSALIGDSACYVGYVRAGNLLYLVDDVSPGLLGPVVPNSGSGSMQNSQCSVNGVGTTSAVSGTDLTLTVNVTFKPIFVGPKIVYAAAQTSTPGNTGWQSRGFWKVQ